ncbi:hypothetical protein ACFOD9_00275 [Novosphingobium bradum]|uniref:Dihydrodipicolinate reductase n=1 Tax=Novosphingobium bradum TaxID=1737444 RepID=A0ABV7IN28_9SPHN
MAKVIQWATGTVGRHAVRAVIEQPGLELVGAYVYDPAKSGRDIGEICGVAPIGVAATNDRAAILAMEADCVLYMPQGADREPAGAIDDICALLESGKNVISTAVTALIYPISLGQGVVDRLNAACARGGVSFHGTGIEPGWGSECLPLAMSPLFRRIDSLLVQEILDYATYPSRATLFDGMGFGGPPQPHGPMPVPLDQSGAFGAPLLMLADAFGATIESMVYECELAVAEEAFDVAAGRIEKGTVSGKRYSFTAMVKGRPAMKVEHVTRLGAHTAPHWPQGRGWHVTIKGDPDMTLQTIIAPDGGDENDQGCLGTAMHAVHAIAPVVEAAPGIRTFLDLPMIVGRNIL